MPKHLFWFSQVQRKCSLNNLEVYKLSNMYIEWRSCIEWNPQWRYPNLHKEAVLCQIFKGLDVFCSSNLNIYIFFVSIEFHDNQHENSHAVLGCSACLGIWAWRCLMWMVCYIIREKIQLNFKVKDTCFKSATFCCFTQTRTLKIWKY